MRCLKCSRIVPDKSLENGFCFFCDPTADEQKEINAVLQIAEVLSKFKDPRAVARISDWAAHKVMNEM